VSGVRFGLLGPLEAVDDGVGDRTPTAPRQRRLLLALLVSGAHPLTPERLAEIVWPEEGDRPQDPVRTIRTYVSRLRAILEPDGVDDAPGVLVGGPDHYRLVLEDQELDAVVFEEEVSAAAGLVDDDPDAALREVERALDRWRGPALAEVADEPWAQPMAIRLEEMHLAAQELRFRCLLDTDRAVEAHRQLEEHVRRHPLRERPFGQLLVALQRTGRMAEATRRFQAYRDRLAEETGLDPSPELVDLHSRLLGDAERVGSGATATWNLLPAARTELVGRDAESAAVARALETSRVLTLTGVGGVGKTRLALAVSQSRRADGDDVAWVDLSPVTSDDDVVSAVFAALRVPTAARADHLEGLVRLLGAQPAVLVLDNCEHVVEGAASLVDRATQAGPKLTVLATSREPLGLDGEHVYRVPSLDQDTGAALFLARARVSVSAPIRARAREIALRLDGIPLAIELAAARTAHLGIDDLTIRLDERFWLLTGGRRSLARHRTLRATMDWSYDLLPTPEQAALRAASVFVGGFDAAGLAGILDIDEHDALDRLATLVDASLVEVDSGTSPTRYRLLETVRLYAEERLVEAGEADTVRQAHTEHYLERALRSPPTIVDLAPWWWSADEDAADSANQVAALERLDRAGRLQDVGRLAARLATRFISRGFSDSDRRFLCRSDVIEALHDEAERALYLLASADDANHLGRLSEQFEYGRAAVASATDPRVRGAAAIYTFLAGSIAAAAEGQQALHGLDLQRMVDAALAALPDDAPVISHHLRLQRPMGLLVQGRCAESVDLLEELVADGDGFAASELMVVLHVLGEHDRALRVPAPSEVQVGYGLWDYRVPLARAMVAAAQQQHEQAQQCLAAAAVEVRGHPMPLCDRDVLLGCAVLAHHAGEHRRASRLLAALRGLTRTPGTFAAYLAYRDRVRDTLDPAERRAILETTVSHQPATALARELSRRSERQPHRSGSNRL
jgi:predicted ATPase/DNA-binding SARP family transcriptional activator